MIIFWSDRKLVNYYHKIMFQINAILFCNYKNKLEYYNNFWLNHVTLKTGSNDTENSTASQEQIQKYL